VTDLRVPGLPFALESSGSPACAASLAGGALTLASGPKSDLFIDPTGDEAGRPDAGRWTGLPGDSDFTLRARVTVGFAATFDAGVLLVYQSERRFAKLCYEFSPQRTPTAVTVVTRGTSDDSNSFETAGGPLWLRVTRSGRAWAFHASTDGGYWRLLRYFTLGEASGARVGFLAQSPTGVGCTAIFDSVAYAPAAPADLRDGSLRRGRLGSVLDRGRGRNVRGGNRRRGRAEERQADENRENDFPGQLHGKPPCRAGAVGHVTSVSEDFPCRQRQVTAC
jgi:hypothetical protein